jgi:hypothetical protein
MNISKLAAIGSLVVLASCSPKTPVSYRENQFINYDSCIAQLAFKAKLLKEPGSKNEMNTLSVLNKNELVYVVGFYEGYAVVHYQGKEGYISDAYLKNNIFLDYWKHEYYENEREFARKEDLAGDIQ